MLLFSDLEMKLKRSFKIQQNNRNPTVGERYSDSGRWRDLISYWIFGMCNNYGYVIMLSAAHDIIKSLDSNGQVSFLLAHVSWYCIQMCCLINFRIFLLGFYAIGSKATWKSANLSGYECRCHSVSWYYSSACYQFA